MDLRYNKKSILFRNGKYSAKNNVTGVDRLCKDVEFMIGRNPGIYWRLCWGFITPILMMIILVYTFATYKPLTYKEYTYPDAAYGTINLPATS